MLLYILCKVKKNNFQLTFLYYFSLKLFSSTKAFMHMTESKFSVTHSTLKYSESVDLGEISAPFKCMRLDQKRKKTN